MLIHELTTDECFEVLRHAHVARLACSRDDHPYVVPISYDFDGRHLYSFSTIGQKIVWMRENPHVCVEVEDIHDRFHWTTVLVFGRYEELRSEEEHARAREQARRLFAQREEWWLPGTAKAGPLDRSVPIVYRIAITRVSGRRADR